MLGFSRGVGGRAHSIPSESELLDGKEVEVVRLVEVRGEREVEVVGGRVAGRVARARGHAQATLICEPSGHTRLVNANARSIALGSNLFVNMSPLWEDVS